MKVESLLIRKELFSNETITKYGEWIMLIKYLKYDSSIYKIIGKKRNGKKLRNVN